jgi:hypothetical protein
MSNLLGGNSKQSSTSGSTSSNQAFPSLLDAFGSVTGQTANSGSLISQLLGMSSGDAGSAGLNSYRDSTGYADQLAQGSKAISGNASAKGLLNSGATAKALQGYGQNLADQSFNGYLSNLFNFGNQGLQAGSVISGAGGTSNSTSTSKGSSKQGLGL